MVSNPNFYGQSTTGTPNQIEDGVDFPHTGIIKALSLGLGQNYVISGFDITAGTNQYTQIDVSAGVICREGKVISSGGQLASGVSDLTMGYTTANGYHLLVVDSSNNIVFRSPSAVDKVPSYNASDIIIAVVTYKGSSTSPDIQYLTFKKAENSLSVARSASGTYTEMGTITCDTDSLDIVTTNSNADIILDPHGTGDVKLGNLAIDGDQTVGSSQDGYVLTYTHSNTNAALAALPASDVTTDADGDTKIQVEESSDEDKIRFDTAGTERMIIDETGKVGIGTDSPDAPLHVETSGVGDAVIIESTDTGATEAPDLVLYRNSASPAVSDEIGSIRFRGKDSSAGDKDYNRITSVIRDTTAASADADLIFQSLSNSVEIEMMKISRIDGIVINEIGASYIDTRIEGDTDANLFFTDASVDRVGIGTNTPTEKLSVSGGIGASAYLGSVTEISGNGSALPPVNGLTLDSSTHRTIIADTQASAPNPPNNLALTLPAASGAHQGWEMRIIAKNNAGGADNLTLEVTGSSDLIIDATGATIGNSSAGLTLATGKIYTVIHISSTQYMAIVLN
jgi:hypothetical protein